MEVFSSDDYRARVSRLLNLISQEISKDSHNWDDLEELIDISRHMAHVLGKWQAKQHEVDPQASVGHY